MNGKDIAEPTATPVELGPPPALVERMAKTFETTDGDLLAVMKTMLDSKEFWSEGAYSWQAFLELYFQISPPRSLGGNCLGSSAFVMNM